MMRLGFCSLQTNVVIVKSRNVHPYQSVRQYRDLQCPGLQFHHSRHSKTCWPM